MKGSFCNPPPIARLNIKRSLLLFILTGMMGFFNFVYSQEAQPSSTPANLVTTTAVDAAMEKIRMFYGLGQYDKVVIECRKLEKITPGNKMVNYYRTRAESKLAEKGLLEGLKMPPEPTPTPKAAQTTAAPPAPPSGATPVVINPIGATPAAAIPAGTAPAGTLSVLNPFGVPPATTATPAAGTPAATSPAGPNPFEAPPVTAPLGIAKPSPTPTPKPATGVEKKAEGSPVGEPSRAEAPAAATPVPSAPAVSKSFLSENLNLIVAVAVAAVALIMVVFLIMRIIKKMGARAGVTAEEPTGEVDAGIPERAKTRMSFTTPLPDEFQQGVPDFPEPPPEVGEIPGIPTPSPAGDLTVPRVTKPRMDADFPTPFPDVPDVPDIESPVTSKPTPQGSLDIFNIPDIPGPTQMPPTAKPSPVKPRAQAGAPGTPPDLPSLDFTGDFGPTPDVVEPELPLLPSLRRESSIPEPEPPSAIETPIPETDVISFDFPPALEPLPSPQAVAQTPEFPEEPQFEKPLTPDIPSPPIEFDNMDVMSAPTMSAAPPMTEGKPQAPPSISIEEALGFDFTTDEKPQEKEAPIAGPLEAMSSTSMDLETFLFSAASEEQSETVVATEQPHETRTEAPSSSQPMMESFDSLMFAGETGQETQLVSSEETRNKPPEMSPAASSPEERIVPTTLPTSPRISPEFPKSAPAAPVRAEESQRTTGAEATPSERVFQELSLESLGQVVAEGERAPKKGQGVPPSRQKIEERNEVLFADQFKKGREAFEKKDWKKAVHYLSVASAIKPEVEELEEMLSVARQRKRAAE
ncbi:MAG: hypothetical protein NT106_04330 [Candidatus Sumerlaeota bacterium]|nr:hypothetical protein [Candidatus Sumerlaeota bacterium]